MTNRICIEQRVIVVAEKILHHQHYVSPIDVFIGIGVLQPVHLQDWRQGRIPYLERVIQGSLNKISYTMKCFRTWATRKGLKPSETDYLIRTKGLKIELQFSKTCNPQIEAAYRTHYISPSLSQQKQEKSKKIENAHESIKEKPALPELPWFSHPC